VAEATFARQFTRGTDLSVDKLLPLASPLAENLKIT